MLQTFICEQCGKEYTSKKPNSKHCSKECQQKYRESQRKKYNCDYCGKEIMIKNCEYQALKSGKHKKKYCSKECANKGAFTSKKIKCRNCGKEFFRSPSMIMEYNYCSHNCYNEYKMKNSKASKKVCPICKNEFETYHPNQICCSKECAGISIRNRVHCVCENCGKEFERIASEANKNEKHFCCKQCMKEYFGWTKEDVEFLKNNYGKITSEEISKIIDYRHSGREVCRKAAEIGLSICSFWTKEEEEILKDNYSKIPMSEVQKLLPKRTLPSILGKARSFGLISYFNISKTYTDEDNQYLRDNYLLKTDEEMANHLNRSVNAIQQKLRLLDLHRPFDLKTKAYKGLSDYVRSRLYIWKSQFREDNNYTCAITGKRSNIIVHHCRGFNLLLEETIEALNFSIKDNFQDYTNEELDEFVTVFMEIQNEYDACVCITEDIHKLFHKEYGYGNNTVEQWEQFVNDYRNGKYAKAA